MKTKLIALSICPCGFPTLDESIPLGTEYEIDPKSTDSFDFICGGCGAQQKITGVYVHPRCSGQGGGYLPIQIFDLNPDIEAIVE